ncbi:MAG: chemotaxis protein CheD [Blastocatellia bacterium]
MKYLVGMGDMAVSSDPQARLITCALGSCLGIAIYDPVARVGGLLHVMLPDSGIESGSTNLPYRYVNTGVPLLFRACYELGAARERLIVKVAGGASGHQGAGDYFQIGKRNFAALRQLLDKNQMPIHAAEIGGSDSRTMMLEIGSGNVLLKINGQTRRL